MTPAETIVLYFTAASSLGGLIIGYRLELHNRRNSMRELVYAKQFEFYLEFNRLTASIDDVFFECQNLINDKKPTVSIAERLEKRIDKLDNHFSAHEILVTDALFEMMNNYIKQSYVILKMIKENNSSLDKKVVDVILTGSTELHIEVMDCCGIEKLSKENTNLANRSKSKIERQMKIY